MLTIKIWLFINLVCFVVCFIYYLQIKNTVKDLLLIENLIGVKNKPIKTFLNILRNYKGMIFIPITLILIINFVLAFLINLIYHLCL